MSLSYPSDDCNLAPRSRGSVRLAPILIGSALALTALAGDTKIGAWLRGFFSAADPRVRRQLRERLQGGISSEALRAMILGRRKAFVASTFGPPRTAVLRQPRSGAIGLGAIGQTGFWRGDTWYYAFDPAARTALVVEFENDVARDVSLIAAPKLES
jgi:hypothetical protein